MSLARVWTRQLYGAWGVALLVPGTVAVALVLLGVAGGFGRLSTLGQAFAGPAVPTATKIGSARQHASPTPPLVPARHARGAASKATAVAATPTVAAPGGGVTQTGPAGLPAGHGTGTGSGSGGNTGGHHGGGAGSPTPSPTPTPTPTPTPGAPPAAKPTLVDGVVNLGASVASKVPGPVGTAATQLLQNLGQTVNGLLPLARRPAATDNSAGATSSQSADTTSAAGGQ